MRALTILTAFILSLTLISAVTIYSGESYELELEKSFDYYSIIGNSTEVILDIIQDGNNVTITPNIYSESDSYEIIFFDKNTETITVRSGGGGGGGGSRTVYKNITEYIDREVILYLNNESEVKEENVVVDNDEKFPWYFYVSAFVTVIMIFILLFISNRNKLENSDTVERGNEEDE